MASNTTRKNVLVTGGAGYIGSHTCKALAAAGYRPVTYDNLSRGHARAVKWGPLERGDLLDATRLGRVMRKHRPVAVLHFAAVANVGESQQDPLRCFLVNVAGTVGLLDAMAANGVTRIVFSSSCAVYGAPRRVPIREGDPQRPLNPYAQSKQMVEEILLKRARSGLRSVALRYFNAAGADPGGQIGEAHEPETHLVPLLLQVAAGKRPRLTLHGDDYKTRDGTCVRDYIHVSDLAVAHVLAMRSLRVRRGATQINLGTGTGYTVREVVEAASRVTGRKIAVRMGPRRPGDSPALVADARRARSVLGWRPRHSDIHEIIKTAWRWQRRR